MLKITWGFIILIKDLKYYIKKRLNKNQPKNIILRYTIIDSISFLKEIWIFIFFFKNIISKFFNKKISNIIPLYNTIHYIKNFIFQNMILNFIWLKKLFHQVLFLIQDIDISSIIQIQYCNKKAYNFRSSIKKITS